MFAKPYKLKSNTTLKNSEKKHLAQCIQENFPSVPIEKIKEIVPVKSCCTLLKLVLHSGDFVNVYTVDSVPMVMETDNGLVPTVCALWKVPELVPSITIHSPVLSKMQGGAPLYLPGVVLPPGGIGFPLFNRGALLAVCTEDNMAAGAIGRSSMSSADMLLRTAGVCLDPIQMIGDQLCKEVKFAKIERPKLGASSYGSGDITINLSSAISQLSIQPPVKEDWPALGRPPAAAPAAPSPVPEPPAELSVAPHNAPRIIPAPSDVMDIDQELQTDVDNMITESSEQEENKIPTDMDGLLQWCLLSFLKLHGKTIELPLKTNLLYKNYLFPLCPPDRTLDVKKSSYKKMSKFLQAMQLDGLLEVRELEKGVASVVAVSPASPLVRAHRCPAPAAAAPAAAAADYAPPLVSEMLCVTAAVLPLLAPHKKGTALTSGEVRVALTQYVKQHNLNAVKGAVTLDALLAKIVGKPEQTAVKWDELMTAVQGKMTESTEMRFADGTVRLSKTRLEPITMQVANRSGNKKVTLVSNLESFGFCLAALAPAWQQRAAAACGVTRSPAARADQLMLQGDQTHFVAKLLIEEYGLPKKFVEGADKALNKKK